MKKIFYFLLLALFTITLYPQEMVVQKTDGTNIFLDMNTIVMINFIIPCPGTPTVDYEGKTYNTVLIGNQCWLKENLDVGTMINGSSNQANNGIVEKYCYNNALDSCTKYGGLYQWNEAMQYVTTQGAKGICPDGWHIPKISEFTTLNTTVDQDGNSLKAIGEGTDGGAGTNTSGFSALLAGYTNGIFEGLGERTFFSISYQISSNLTYSYQLNNWNRNYDWILNPKDYGCSVRCIKD